MAWRWARPRTTTDDDEDAIHLAFSTDRGGYKRWQAISSGTRRRGPFFIETWKRKESRHAMEWGTIGFEDVERDRPEYAEDPLTVVTNSPVDGMETTYFPVDVAAKRKTQSTGVIVF